MPWLIDEDDEHGLINEIFDCPDRIAGLLAPVLIDRRLEKTIRSRWQDDGEILRDLFRDGGPLGSFAIRTKVGFAIGLYGKETYQDLREINRIRNAFAHQLEATDFQYESIRDRVKKLTLPTRYPAAKELTLEGLDELTHEPHGSLFQFAMRLVGFSSISPLLAINSPRGRFLRTVEILLILLGSEALAAGTHRAHGDNLKPKF